MTNGVEDFCSSDIEEVKKLVLYVVIGSLVPCMVGIALSQELSRWPVGEATFKIW